MMNRLLPKRSTSVALMASFALLPFSSQADWMLVEDFESYSAATPPVIGTDIMMASNGGSGQIDIYEGVPGAGGNNAAHLQFGTVLHSAGDVWFEFDLPEDIEVDTTGTIFFRVWQSTFSVNYLAIASKTPAGDSPDDTALWGTFSALFRYNAADPVMWDAHNGGYQASNPLTAPDLQTWYNVWMVLDNSYNAADEQTGGYKVYIQSPTDAEPVLMTWGASMASDLVFRNQTKDSIKTFVTSNNDFGITPDGVHLFDDIWMTQGECISDPTMGGTCDAAAVMWGEFPTEVGTDGLLWADTGAWMGWLQVEYAIGGAGWVYCLDLDTWMFFGKAPESGETGSWVFAAK